MKFKIGDKVRVKSGLVHGRKYGAILYWDDFKDKDFIVEEYDSKDNTYRCFYNMSEYWLSEEMLEPAYAEGGYVSYGKIPTPSKPIPIEEQLGLPKSVSIHDLNPIEWHRPMGIPPMFFPNRSVGKRAALDALVDSYSKLGCTSFLMPTDKIEKIVKEDKPMKFTFSTYEGYRMDKSNNTKVPTITTIMMCGCEIAEVTCDKTDYDERQGVLEAVAQLYCNGSFDEAYKDAIKLNKAIDRANRTCKYCGKLFVTVEEKEAHEAWHVERRKARHERYKLRKRAKEIAFEEAAQKLAKEMTGEK